MHSFCTASSMVWHPLTKWRSGWACVSVEVWDSNLDAAVNVGQVCRDTLCANNVIQAQLPHKRRALQKQREWLTYASSSTCASKSILAIAQASPCPASTRSAQESSC